MIFVDSKIWMISIILKGNITVNKQNRLNVHPYRQGHMVKGISTVKFIRRTCFLTLAVGINGND